MARGKAIINELKNRPCADCGVKYPPCVMDFDHRDPSTKRGDVGTMCMAALKTLRDEAAKCEVVCANCHRIRTAKQQIKGLFKKNFGESNQLPLRFTDEVAV